MPLDNAKMTTQCLWSRRPWS